MLVSAAGNNREPLDREAKILVVRSASSQIYQVFHNNNKFGNKDELQRGLYKELIMVNEEEDVEMKEVKDDEEESGGDDHFAGLMQFIEKKRKKHDDNSKVQSKNTTANNNENIGILSRIGTSKSLFLFYYIIIIIHIIFFNFTTSYIVIQQLLSNAQIKSAANARQYQARTKG